MGQTNEPSMEEILSSIKRIIAEDNEAPAPRRAGAVPARAADPDVEEPDVLELTDTVGEPEALETDEAEPKPVSAEEAPAIASAPVAPAARHAFPSAQAERDALLSATTEEATRQALADLSRMVIRPESPVADNTLEGLVREMLRPMLKDWLDANLPRIVQATIDREVARIAGRNL